MKRRKGRKMDSQAGRKREGAWSQESPRSRVSAREPASQHAALAQFRGTEKGRRQPHRAAASKSPKGGERQNRGPSSTREGERAGRRHRDRETGPALCVPVRHGPPRSPSGTLCCTALHRVGDRRPFPSAPSGPLEVSLPFLLIQMQIPQGYPRLLHHRGIKAEGRKNPSFPTSPANFPN